MRVRVIAVGERMPRWVDEVYADYAKRLPAALKPLLIQIPAGQRSAGRDGAQAMRAEGERILAALAPRDFVIALDEHGREFTTRELSTWLQARMQDGRDLAFLIGGPDGHAQEVLARADLKWSLSKLTLPHALVRVVLGEQLYRAHTVMSGHPYHRD